MVENVFKKLKEGHTFLLNRHIRHETENGIKVNLFNTGDVCIENGKRTKWINNYEFAEANINTAELFKELKNGIIHNLQ